MAINTALLKYGFSNFSLEVLEFCEASKLMQQEQYYFDTLRPEYNILKTPGSPDRGKGWKHSAATLEKIRLAAINRSPEQLNRSSIAQPSSQKLEVINIITGVKTIYHAMKAAARELGIDRRYIENYIYLKQKKPVIDKYIFNFVDGNVNNINKQSTCKKIQVLDLEKNTKMIYPSITKAARILGLRQAAISLYLKDERTKPYRKRYLFTLV